MSVTSSPPAIRDSQNFVEVSFSARPELFLLARMTASAVAAKENFTLGEIDDLRLAIDELCSLCCAGASEESRVSLSFLGKQDRLEVHCTVSPVELSDGLGFLDPDTETESDNAKLARAILVSLTDDYGFDLVDGDTCCAWLYKARATAASKQ